MCKGFVDFFLGLLPLYNPLNFTGLHGAFKDANYNWEMKEALFNCGAERELSFVWDFEFPVHAVGPMKGASHMVDYSGKIHFSDSKINRVPSIQREFKLSFNCGVLTKFVVGEYARNLKRQ